MSVRSVSSVSRTLSAPPRVPQRAWSAWLSWMCISLAAQPRRHWAGRLDTAACARRLPAARGLGNHTRSVRR